MSRCAVVSSHRAKVRSSMVCGVASVDGCVLAAVVAVDELAPAAVACVAHVEGLRLLVGQSFERPVPAAWRLVACAAHVHVSSGFIGFGRIRVDSLHEFADGEKSSCVRIRVWYSRPSSSRLKSVHQPAMSGLSLSRSWSCMPLISISSPMVSMCSRSCMASQQGLSA